MFKNKIIKNVYPGKPQFYNIKAGCKGVYISRTCLHDERGQKFSCIIMVKNTNKSQRYTKGFKFIHIAPRIKKSI